MALDLTPTYEELDGFGEDGSIKIQWWQPEGETLATVLHLHGLGGRGAWHQALAAELVRHGIASVAFDQIGFGARKTYPLSSYRQWLDEAFWILRTSPRNKHKLFLLGNSMGSLVAYAIANRASDYASGVILMAPAFVANSRTFTPWYQVSSLVKAMICPNRPLQVPIEPCDFVRDEAALAWIENDLQGERTLPGKIMFELLKLNAKLRFQNDLSIPILMLTAGRDLLVDNDAARRKFAKLAPPSKQHFHFAEAFHDIILDPVVGEAGSVIANWIKHESTPIIGRV